MSEQPTTPPPTGPVPQPWPQQDLAQQAWAQRPSPQQTWPQQELAQQPAVQQELAQPPMTPPPPRDRRVARALLASGLGLVMFLAVWIGLASVIMIHAHRHPLSEYDEELAKSDMKVAWTVEYPGKTDGASVRDTHSTFGLWLSGDMVVRAQADGVLAHSVRDGRRAWGTPLPDGMQMCSASTGTDHDMAALAFGPGDRCNQVAGLDLRTGALLPTATIPAKVKSGRNGLVEKPTIEVGDGVALVATSATGQYEATYHSLIGIGLADGKQRWTTKPEIGGGVLGLAVAGTKAVATVAVKARTSAAVGLDAATGQERWRVPAAGGSTFGSVLSVSPPAVAVAEGGSTNVLVLDDSGNRVTSFSTRFDGGQLDLQPAASLVGFNYGLPPYVVKDNILYARLKTTSLPGKQTGGQVIAIHLMTGARKWSSSGTTGGRVYVVRIDGTNLLVTDSGGVAAEDKPRLLRVTLSSGKIANGPTIPFVLGTSMLSAVVLESGGTVMVTNPMGSFDGHAIVGLRTKGR